MTFTKEQLEFLSVYEDRFHTAIHLNYYRNVTNAALNKIANVYDEATGTKTNRNFGCSACIMNYLREVGKLYFKDKEEYNKKAQEFVEVLDAIFADIDPETVQETEETAPKTVQKPVAAISRKSSAKKPSTKKKTTK